MESLSSQLKESMFSRDLGNAQQIKQAISHSIQEVSRHHAFSTYHLQNALWQLKDEIRKPKYMRIYTTKTRNEFITDDLNNGLYFSTTFGPQRDKRIQAFENTFDSEISPTKVKYLENNNRKIAKNLLLYYQRDEQIDEFFDQRLSFTTETKTKLHIIANIYIGADMTCLRDIKK